MTSWYSSRKSLIIFPKVLVIRPNEKLAVKAGHSFNSTIYYFYETFPTLHKFSPPMCPPLPVCCRARKTPVQYQRRRSAALPAWRNGGRRESLCPDGRGSYQCRADVFRPT